MTTVATARILHFPGAAAPADPAALAVCTDPAEFARLAAEWSRCAELWIDTETADWQTPNPRLSLLQVRTPDRGPFVVDMLAAGMRPVLETLFVPAVMANPAIRKWAHNAAYERRFLGGDSVQNLKCTVRLARSIPYHRLPVRKLTLASLCDHLLGTTVDKAHQADDWGVRPLSMEQIAYAAADPEWCRLVQRRLDALVVTFDPGDENPAEVRASFLDVTARLRERKARREDIREAVTQQMLEEDRDLFGGFRLHRRLVPVSAIRELVRVADALDPGRIFEFTTAVPRALRDALDPAGRAAVRAICASKTFRAFRGPRVPGSEPRYVFPLADYDAAEVDRQYAEIDDQRRRLESEREELRDRMRAWLELHALSEWEGFKIADPEERWSADMRRLVALAPAAGDREIQVPRAFTLAFGGGVVDRLETTSRESAFVMWRERTGTRVDPQAAQSRDWHEDDGATEGA